MPGPRHPAGPAALLPDPGGSVLEEDLALTGTPTTMPGSSDHTISDERGT